MPPPPTAEEEMPITPMVRHRSCATICLLCLILLAVGCAPRSSSDAPIATALVTPAPGATATARRITLFDTTPTTVAPTTQPVATATGPNVVGQGEGNDAAVGDAEIRAAFATERSGFMVVVEGVVARRLADDNDGSRHQRFILALTSGHTVLVSHNIDLAPYVPLSEGDVVRLRGQYEWNEQGGVLHWTHHDPQGYHEEGWIEWEGARFE